MDTSNRDDITKVSDDAPKTLRNYNFLLRLSRKMGTVATKSSFVSDVKSFMSHEIAFTPPERLFGSSSTQERGDVVPIASAESPADIEREKGRQLKTIVERSHEVLMTANTVFPITLFPDTVTVDRTKVTITRRDFFWTSDVLSIRIEDVLNVQASVGPLFGSLTIASRVMSTVDHFQIKHLWRNEAIQLKQVIQGYVIAQHNQIDTAHLEKKELLATVAELGHDTN